MTKLQLAGAAAALGLIVGSQFFGHGHDHTSDRKHYENVQDVEVDGDASTVRLAVSGMT